MRSINLSELSWNDFVANGVFFLLDILLLSILVPLFVNWTDKRKWSKARQKTAIRSAHYLEMLNLYANNLSNNISVLMMYFPKTFSEENPAYVKSGHDTYKDILIGKILDYINGFDNSIKEVSYSYLQEIQILTPSFNSEIAIKVIEFYEVSSRLYLLCLSDLRYLIMVKDDDVEKAINYQLIDELYKELLLKLASLCRVVNHQIEKDENLIIIKDLHSSVPEYNRLVFPKSPSLVDSMRFIFDKISCITVNNNEIL